MILKTKLLDDVYVLVLRGHYDGARSALTNSTGISTTEVKIANAVIEHFVGNYDNALRELRSIKKSLDGSESLLIGEVALLESLVLARLNNYNESASSCETAIRMFRSINHESRLAFALIRKAELLAIQLDTKLLPAIESILREAEVLATKTKNRVASTRLKIVELHLSQNSDVADPSILEKCHEAFRLADECGDLWSEVRVAGIWSQALLESGYYNEAIDKSDEAIEIANQIDSKENLAINLIFRSKLLRDLDRLDDSYESAMAATRLASHSFITCQALISTSITLAKMTNYNEAVETIERAIGIAEESKNPGLISKSSIAGVWIMSNAGMLSESRKLGEKTKALFQPYEHQIDAALSGFLIEELLREKHKVERTFHKRLAEAPKDLKSIGRIPPEDKGALIVLRDWASWTTVAPMRRKEGTSPKGAKKTSVSSTDKVSGGYLLRWGGKGLLIDPGIGILRALVSEGLCYRHFDEILITHYHVDHLGDLLQILTCEHELKDAITKKHIQMERDVAVYVSNGCYSAIDGMLFELLGIRTTPLDPDTEKVSALGGSITITATPTYHRDLTNKPVVDGTKTNTIGAKIELLSETGEVAKTIGITSDTGWRPEVGTAFSEDNPADILVLHIGSVYEEDLVSDKYAKDHLGWNGSRSLVSKMADIQGEASWTALVCEWGEELSSRRTEICKGLQMSAGSGRVVPSVRGMYVSLPSGSIMCQACGKRVAKNWITIPGGRIVHICTECYVIS